MIINAEVAIYIPGQSFRFSRAKVGVGQDPRNKSYYLVVIRTNQKDHFRLIKSNVKFFRSTFQFQSPNRYVMIRDYNEALFQTLKSLIRKIVDNNTPIPKLPSIDRINAMKPSPASLTSIGAAKTELKKLTNKCYKKIELSNLTRIPLEVWTMKSLSVLSLVDCNLKIVPRELQKLNNTLQCLILRENQIEEIPMWFCKQMHQLKTIDLSWNKLRLLPFEIVFLRSCKSFNFSHNSIIKLPDLFSIRIFGGYSYDQIDFSHNNISFLQTNETISNINGSQLHSVIDFSNNKFHDDNFFPKLWLEKRQKESNKISLFSITLETILSKPQLFEKLFNDAITPKPVYQTLQDIIFQCMICKKLQIRMDSYICKYSAFPLHNFTGQLRTDHNVNHYSCLFVQCKHCSPIIEIN